jgi:hypothetical protein
MTRPRRWADDDLRRAVAGPPPARSLAEVSRRLGLRQGGPTNRVLRERAAWIGVALPNGWYRVRSVPPLPPPLSIPTPLGHSKDLTPTGGASRGREGG